MIHPLEQLLDSERPEIVSRAKAKAAAMLLELDSPGARSSTGAANEGMADPLVAKLPPRWDGT